jgi:hypothetical protein
LDSHKVTTFYQAWRNNLLTSFPLLDSSQVTTFYQAWYNNNLNSFPLLDFSSATNISYALADNGDLFDIPLEQFDISNVTAATSFLEGTKLTTATYDATLIAWDGLTLQAALTAIHFGDSKYTSGGAAEAARSSLIAKGIAILDGGSV